MKAKAPLWRNKNDPFDFYVIAREYTWAFEGQLV